VRGGPEERPPAAMDDRSEGLGASQVEEGEVELGLIRAGRRHGDLDPADAEADLGAIFRSLSRMVPQVAAANWVWPSPIRRSASSST
jgi:hypothetical protein